MVHVGCVSFEVKVVMFQTVYSMHAVVAAGGDLLLHRLKLSLIVDNLEVALAEQVAQQGFLFVELVFGIAADPV